MHEDSSFDARQVDLRVRLAMRLLEFEQAKVPDVDELAERVGLSTFHFARMFTAQVGESCAAYSRRVRLDSSNNQLIHDAVPLGTVAATFGYRSQAAFTRAYTRQFGMPPKRFVKLVLGRTPADYAASHLDPLAAAAKVAPLLRGQVRLVERPARTALARRFFGYDLAAHWRRFVVELPSGLAEAGQFVGMSYDNARVTPDRHWRYDCAVVIEGSTQGRGVPGGSWGLDLVELPGGWHAECLVQGDFDALWRTVIGLFTEWLPAHREFEPEGDPVVHWLATSPIVMPFTATATIRIRKRGMPPAYNMRPLTRHGRPAGRRSQSAGD